MSVSSTTIGGTVSRGRALKPALLLSLTVALLAAAPQPAHASANQETMVQDDLQLLYSGGARREQTLDELQHLGVDSIRVFVSWSGIAPASNSSARPGFDAANLHRCSGCGGLVYLWPCLACGLTEHADETQA